MKKIFFFSPVLLILALLFSCSAHKEKIDFPLAEGNIWEYTGDHQVGIGPRQVKFSNVPFTLVLEKLKRKEEIQYYIFELQARGQYFRSIRLQVNQDREIYPPAIDQPLLFDEIWKGRSWSTWIFDRRISLKSGGKEEINTTAGKFKAWKIKFSGGRVRGTAWIARGIGLVALDYQSREPENMSRLSIRLKKFRIKEKE
ncbi:MAG: hypothetical protein J7M18_05670 [Candidatus Eremiobacteraeota bacterium]|nr:hypothetical protein [Candidatus Eremiobacteraeota bacterium]